MLSLRNNLSFGFRSQLSQLSLLKCYPESIMLVMQWKIIWLRFLSPGFLHLPLTDWYWQVCCTSGLTTAKLEYGQGKNKALQIGISHHG